MDAVRCWGLMLSVFSVAVVAYRNDLSSRHGCIWSTIEERAKEASAAGSPGTSISSPPGVSLKCNLRTLSMDFWNYTFNRDQVERTRLVDIKCSDKLFFESLLSPNQTLFQLRNLREVQIESCKIRKVPSRVWASLSKLKTLVIRTQNTEWRTSSVVGLEIEHGAFEGLVQLETLDLSQNNIWAFPEQSNILCPMKSLADLNISNNRLSDIDELFSSSSSSCELSVQKVDLSVNSLRHVGKNAFSRLRRLAELRLQHNLIAELDDSAFGGMSQLKLLNLSSNRLVALPPTIFSSNVNLREVYLQNNSLSALSPQLFSNMEHLLLLDLSRNSVTSEWVKESLFQGLIRLVVLKLSHNQLSYVDSDIFRNLISLQALHLDNNRIETISAEAFLSLSNLHILDLSKNRLSYVDGKVFSNLFVLRQLYLDHNKIRQMDDTALNNCTSLQDLGLANNALQEVPVALQSSALGLLKTLDIGENKIVRVSNESFVGMSQLYGLRMVDNRITKLSPGFCGSLRKLRVLNLSQNRISYISPGAFATCSLLRILRLDGNALETLPPTLAPELQSLLWLNASENRLEWTDYQLLPQALEWLDLSHNSLESLTGPITANNKVVGNKIRSNSSFLLPHLRILDASHNKLSHLDQTDIPFSLETLRVNYNQLTTILPNTFMRSLRLRRVELMGNQIEKLPPNSLQFPQSPSGSTLPEFYLGDNPFLCDCSMEWLTRVNQLSIRQHARIVDLDAIVCRTTFSRRSTSIKASGGGGGGSEELLVPLSEARPRDFLCPYKSHCFTLCHCCEFDACDCEMTCPDNCTCYHDTAWSSNIVECSNLEYQQVPARVPMDATEIYLDGNRIFQLESHIFIGKKNLRSLYLNDSHVEVIKNKTFNGLKSLEILRLEENLLTELHGYEFSDLDSLRELYLHNNLLEFIAPDTFVNLKFLQVLRLDGNLLVDFNVWELSRNGYLNSVMLAGNRWSCDCDFLNPFRTWVASKTAIVVDFTSAKCHMSNSDLQYSDDQVLLAGSELSQQADKVQPTISSMCNSPEIAFNYEQHGENMMEINNHISAMGGAAEKVAISQSLPPSENHLNFAKVDAPASASMDNTFWVLALCLSAIIILIIVILAIFRKEIYGWISNHSLSFCCPGKFSGAHHPSKIVCTGADDHEKLFDAYFLYSKKDEDLLLQKIAPELEQNTAHKFRLCLHYRDLCLSPESPWNREMILSACDASKRLVILLSTTFLNSEWASSTHFRTSIQSAISLHHKKLIFILLPNFDQSLSIISPELPKSVMRNASIHWSDKSFWSKLRKMMPSPQPPPLTLESSGHSESPSVINLQSSGSCDPTQLPYTLVMNPNVHQQHHYHQNVTIPYQLPPVPGRTDSLPPVPKLLLPLAPNWESAAAAAATNVLLNPQQQQQQQYRSNRTAGTQPLIHPTNTTAIPSHLGPQQFGYSNETFHLGNHHHPAHNNHGQPIHFSSQQNPHHHHAHPMLAVIPPHSHSHTSSQISNHSNFPSYPPSSSSSSAAARNHNQIIEPNYCSSAGSTSDLDHVYSTLDSPPRRRQGSLSNEETRASSILLLPPPTNANSISQGSPDSRAQMVMAMAKHAAQNSTSSSGVSSGSEMTCGDSSSSAVSPSSPIKNGILNKLAGSSSQASPSQVPPVTSTGKMYFV